MALRKKQFLAFYILHILQKFFNFDIIINQYSKFILFKEDDLLNFESAQYF